MAFSPLVFVLLAYLLGSLSFAVIVSRHFGLPDPRTFGSRNPGATNMLRGGNKSAALLTLVGDVLKGVLALGLAQVFIPDSPERSLILALVTLAAFLGHVFPVFYGFKGGKGVATAAGLMVVLVPPVGGVCVVTWLLMFVLTRVSSVSALSATVMGPVVAYFYLGMGPEFWAIVLMASVLLVRHKSNIKKLLSGEEKPFKRRAA
jgi:glycerol-3-phosphate acyltransferase PlsY